MWSSLSNFLFLVIILFFIFIHNEAKLLTPSSQESRTATSNMSQILSEGIKSFLSESIPKSMPVEPLLTKYFLTKYFLNKYILNKYFLNKSSLTKVLFLSEGSSLFTSKSTGSIREDLTSPGIAEFNLRGDTMLSLSRKRDSDNRAVFGESSENGAHGTQGNRTQENGTQENGTRENGTQGNVDRRDESFLNRPVRRRLQRRSSGSDGIIPDRRPNSLRHSPNWVSGSSFQNHMTRQRAAVVVETEEDQELLQRITSNAKPPNKWNQQRRSDAFESRWASGAENGFQMDDGRDEIRSVESVPIGKPFGTSRENRKNKDQWGDRQMNNSPVVPQNEYRDIIPHPPPEANTKNRWSPMLSSFAKNVKQIVAESGANIAETGAEITTPGPASTFVEDFSPVEIKASEIDSASYPRTKTVRESKKRQKEEAPVLAPSFKDQMLKNEFIETTIGGGTKTAESATHPHGSSLYYPKVGDDKLHDLDLTHRLDDEIAKMQFPISDEVAPDPGMPNIAASTGQLISSSLDQSSTEFLKWAAPVRLEKSIPHPSMREMAFQRYRAPTDRFFQRTSNDIIYDNWWAAWSRAAAPRTTSALVANEFGFVSGGVGLRDGVTDVSTGWKDIVVTEYSNRANQELSIGAAKGKYGVFVDRSNLSRATAVEVVARFFESATLVDFLDRDYGQRISIRNFDLSIRHDFDEFIDPTPDEFATEILVAFRDLGVALSTDVADSRYGITVGFRGRQISVLHDFDERFSDILLNWGRGWQIVLETDFVDPYSQEIFARLGFGRLGRGYFAIG